MDGVRHKSRLTQLYTAFILAGSLLSVISPLSIRFAFCDAIAFAPIPKNSVKPALGVKTMMMTTAESTTIPNWRVLQKDEKDPSSLLSIHVPWSESEYNNSLALFNRLMECTDSYVSPLIKDALNCLDHAYRLYGPESVICSYNGGKDAVVILHLMRAAHAHYYSSCRTADPTVQPCRPRAVYFDHQDEFPEIIELLHDTVHQYDLDMVAFEQGVTFSEGLQLLVDNNCVPGTPRPFPMAFVLGTRSSDPNAGSQGQFAPSSHYMPPFMRVNPVLEWTYGHVWHFVRLFKLPYCCLYDQGYTSLGTVKDTLPCPALAVAGSNRNGSSIPKYWPAYMLRDWEQERAGRIKKHKKAEPATPTPVEPSIDEVQSQKSLTSIDSSAISVIKAGEKLIDCNRATVVDSPLAGEPLAGPSGPVSFSSDETQRSVGLLVIGDEILKGMTADTNTHAAAKALWENNVLLARVVVVSDDQDEIVAEIRRMQNEVDVIITSGGVGPTHDDVTIKSVAVALHHEMVFNEEMGILLLDKMKKGQDNESKALTQAQIKMATLPSHCTLRYLTENKSDWPVLQCQNVFVLPGVPEFFTKKVESLAIYLSSQLKRSVTYKVVLSVDEASIVKVLNAAVEKHPHVSFGSYPFVSHPEFKTVVTLEGRMLPGAVTRNSSIFLDRHDLHQRKSLFSKEQMDLHVRMALDDLIDALPKGSILRVDNNDMSLF